jgi:uroporphyrinogen-III synthase
MAADNVWVAYSKTRAFPHAKKWLKGGHSCILFPMTQIEFLSWTPERENAWKEAMQGVERVIVSSAYALKGLPQALLCDPAWRGKELIVMGKESLTEARAWDLTVRTVVPPGEGSEWLIKHAKISTVKKGVLCLKGEGGRRLITDSCAAQGISFHAFETYRRVRPCLSSSFNWALFLENIHTILVGSMQAVAHIYALVPKILYSLLEEKKWIVPSQRVAVSVRTQYGLSVVMVMEEGL